MSFNIKVSEMHHFDKGESGILCRNEDGDLEYSTPIHDLILLSMHKMALKANGNFELRYTEIVFHARKPMPIRPLEERLAAASDLLDSTLLKSNESFNPAMHNHHHHHHHDERRPPPKRISKSKKFSRNEELLLRREKQRALLANTEEAITVIPKSIMCAVTHQINTGVHYTFLMTHSLKGKKTSAHIGYSKNPMYDLYLHNNLIENDRTTNTAAPDWILDMVLGPFSCLNKAIECSKEWVDNTRGKPSKRKKAYLLSRLYNVNLYTRQIPLKESFTDYIKRTAPPIYSVAHDKLKTTTSTPRVGRNAR
jgi:hypothetical protein